MDKSFREESPTYQIGVTGQRSKRVFQKLLNQECIDLSPEQVGLLNSILEKDGSNMQELSVINDRDNSATTRLVDILEKKGFVERIGVLKDRRVWEIFITPNGKEEIIKANNVGRVYVKKVLKDIDPIELAIFTKVIKAIKQNIAKLE